MGEHRRHRKAQARSLARQLTSRKRAVMQPFHEHHLSTPEDHIGRESITEYASHRVAWRLAGAAALVAVALLFAWMLVRSG